MTEKLSIIITRHNEDEAIVTNLLDSIKMQRGIDFNLIEVIVIDDASEIKLSTEFINKYNFSIKLLNLKTNVGVSAARNLGIKRATTEYLMFCDCDDCFQNNIAIYTLLQRLKSNSDIYIFGFLAEQDLQYITIFSPMFNDNTFIHGKVYKRQYLIDNDIMFDPELKVHEDGYFNTLARIQTTKTELCQDIIYTWCYNKNSITRKDIDFSAKTFHNYIYSSQKLINKVEQLSNIPEEALSGIVGHVIYYSYVERQLPYWNNTAEENKLSFYTALKQYYLSNKKYFEKLSPVEKQYLLAQEMTNGLQRGMTSNIESFEEFITKLEA